jgi:hypothetical protein
LVRGGKLLDGCSVSFGCWRADPGVRQSARTRMPARTLGRPGAQRRGNVFLLMAGWIYRQMNHRRDACRRIFHAP